jgi:hypothetical protein
MSSSCRRKRPQHLPLELEKQYTKLLSKVSLLSATRCSLSHENSLVAVLCDSLLYVQPLASGQQDGKEQQLTELLEAEGQLLQRLGRVPAVPVDQHLELLREAGVDGQGHPVLKLFTERPLVEKGARCGTSQYTACMQSAPASYLREVGLGTVLASGCHLGTPLTTPLLLLACPAMPVCRLTALDMTLVYKQMVQELAVHLQLLDAGMLEPVACAERIRGSCDRCVCAQPGLLLPQHRHTTVSSTCP